MENTKDDTTSGAKEAIVPENHAKAESSPGTSKSSRRVREETPLGNAQDRMEILTQELRNGIAAGLNIQVRYVERDGRKVMLVVVWDVWKCQKCNWPNIVPEIEGCQNPQCPSRLVPEKEVPEKIVPETLTV